ncbi:hypothetical protein SPKIRA_05880 [Sphingomonas paucimobilis]|jgi:hypothetical protein|uniref:DUF2934 domain-containing protein n=2 Tax=Sphingomonas paucimobilis TaxID=13689 RepID=A0A411LFJ9_SPHPI|nr:DUF2934 domain-containing protein [Sphingomonas paucimobilis]RSU68368.1 DUF2934 domain-containing protein [Sphingomonas sp. S-NIH.Pt1_0416]GAN12906.1 hypothetical protein SP6_14_00620 [Sphingomonas paucimobilis NBRC 13935]NNG58073.1 DUF2934 domain-containing protein [Sphingomonas paucimobilis]QBE91126.1 DUF2934 domain-containing protein [Sphingomonas paucimobilis]BCI69758.1 hypothetical protein SPKIRA_05880 [Sphingomonas paucimobilis]
MCHDREKTVDQREEQLRQRAYDIWQAEGEPHGRDRDHWEMAERELSDTPTEEAPKVETEAKPVSTRRKSAGAKTTQTAPATIQDDGVTAKPKTRKPRASKS